ncbi:MAG TPA: hypothetical protein VLT86_17665 [Vicinamibacterales bacterium]|nr:hypothetical protein [Vicinamibacterales bacterium]
MRPRRTVFLAPLFLAVVLAALSSGLSVLATGDLPVRLGDQEFWQLSESLSEPNGQFQSDNLLSNELVFARILPDLIARTKPGGVYLGVGPEQNFTYIAAIKPRMVFITDIRRGNLELQLMYKALFELSPDRADFVGRLFSKKRPAGLSTASTGVDLMNAYWDVPTEDEAAYAANLKAIEDDLTKTHGFPLSPEDLAGVAAVYRAFYWYGPSMNYSANVALTAPTTTRGNTYADLMMQTDVNGVGLSYLGSEEKFAYLKELESRNLIVPVVGNFSGPKALRAVGAYLHEHGATVTAFYLSNVEMYLNRAGTWGAFCANVATMPLDENSLFIRPSGTRGMVLNGGTNWNFTFTVRGTGAGPGGMTAVPATSQPYVSGLVPMAAEVKNCSLPQPIRR